MRPENMPYYRGPRIQKASFDIDKADSLHIQSLLSDLIVSEGGGHTTLSNHQLDLNTLSPLSPTLALKHALY